eukprot:TRINITY_DN9602_c0_g1_i2.p1 TRINITY_DN9602_c0_g1~~TRINITY_DN9602_c0_g1_i2.p1  ORF type:complete len:458 (-),score=108.07 TRINITY_DN9602_c0_g1_i2:118-1491(-)
MQVDLVKASHPELCRSGPLSKGTVATLARDRAALADPPPASAADKMAAPVRIHRFFELPVELEDDADDDADGEEQQQRPSRTDCLSEQSFQMQVDLFKKSHPELYSSDAPSKGTVAILACDGGALAHPPPAFAADKMAAPVRIHRCFEPPVELEDDAGDDAHDDDDADGEEQQRGPGRTDCSSGQSFHMQVDLVKASHPELCRSGPLSKGTVATLARDRAALADPPPASAADKMAAPVRIHRFFELPVELEDDADDDAAGEERQQRPSRTDCLSEQSFQMQVDLFKKSHPELCRSDPLSKGMGAKPFSPSYLLGSCPILDSDDSDDDCSSSSAAKRSAAVSQEVFEGAVHELRKKSPQLFAGNRARSLSESAGFLTHPRRPPRNRCLKSGSPQSSATMAALASRLRMKPLANQLSDCPIPEKDDGTAGEGSIEAGVEAFSCLSSSSDDDMSAEPSCM